MNREEFLDILKEENVEFYVNEDLDVIVREEHVLIHVDNEDEAAYIIPYKPSIDDGIFSTLEETPLSQVTREDVMKMVEAYRNTEK